MVRTGRREAMATAKTAWVTGAGGALGGAVVRRLAMDGWRGIASVGRAGAAVPAGWRAEAARLDGEGPADAQVAAALAAFGGLDLAVLAAGAWEGGAPAYESDARALERMWRANVETAWQCARAAAAAMAEGTAVGPRSIVLISAFTALAWPAPAGQSAYRAAKAAVASLADALAAELADAGVSVFALAPTTLDTEANRRAMPSADPARWLRLDDVAEIVAFLATPAARSLSGAVLALDGRVRS
jgi:NAD(P)-dependent dehydrogenase (short-subunit alcohol dehydrogenase family)